MGTKINLSSKLSRIRTVLSLSDWKCSELQWSFFLRNGSRPEETGAGGSPRRCGFSKAQVHRECSRVGSKFSAFSAARTKPWMDRRPQPKQHPCVGPRNQGCRTQSGGPWSHYKKSDENVAPGEFRDGRPSPETATLCPPQSGRCVRKAPVA